MMKQYLAMRRELAADVRKAWVAVREAREAVLAAMGRNHITALVYPTLRRKPAPIGEPQAGSNCQLSATTGFPATVRKSLSTPGPMRVPFPAATMMALFIATRLTITIAGRK